MIQLWLFLKISEKIVVKSGKKWEDPLSLKSRLLFKQKYYVQIPR